MDNFVDELKFKFNIDTHFFESLFQSEQPVEDVTMDYNIPGVGNFNLTVFDKKYFVDGVEFFRPFIRGFLVVLMCLYNIRQLIGFFGYDAGVVAGRSDGISESKDSQRGGK